MPVQLEELKKTFGIKEQPRLLKLLIQLSRRRFNDAGSLIRFHENLVFMLAYPQSKKLLLQTRILLASFPKRINYLKKINADLAPFEDPEVSGIAGTTLTVMTGYKFALWLSEHHTKDADIDWEGYEEEAAVGATLPRILPLLEEEGLVEAHLSFREYIHAAKPKKGKDLEWLMKNFSRLKINEKQKAELYEYLKFFIRFAPRFNSSRTGLKLGVEEIFYHEEPLIRRRDISLEKELSRGTLKIKKLPARKGSEIMNIIRTASIVRFRELHGFIWGDAKTFWQVDLGRGVIVFLNEVLPENRLPLRAYHSGFIFKNGIPVGYVECISLFEKMEAGFNLYYTFRDGETAWLYAQLLRIFKQHMGITVFSVDPYQVGHENEEGIESGAFWFYRKLGFGPVQDEVSQIVESEEKKIAKHKDYRTSATILRKIAKSHLLYTYKTPGTGRPADFQNSWKDFHLRNILFAVQKKMSQKFNGSSAEMRKVTTQYALRLLNVDLKDPTQTDAKAFSNFALLLSVIPGFSKWTREEKDLLVKIIRAKGSGSETEYLRLMQKHVKLREAFLRLGFEV